MDLFQGEGAALLIQALLSLQDEAECRAFLEDLMTSREIQDCGQRLLVAQLLRENMVYSRIAQATGASSATISRVNRSLNYGTDSYRTLFARLQAEDEAAEGKP